MPALAPLAGRSPRNKPPSPTPFVHLSAGDINPFGDKPGAGLLQFEKGAPPRPSDFPYIEMTSLNDRPSPTELSPEFSPEMRAGLNDVIGHARSAGLSDAAIAQAQESSNE